jgi:hypothetical protein
MAKVFRPSTRESSLLSRIESSKEQTRRRSISGIRDCMEPLSNAVAMKLVESKLVETKNKNSLEKQLYKCLDELTQAEDFDVDYAVAPFRDLVPQYNIVSLYLMRYVIEEMIDHKDVVDIYGSDEDIYRCIDEQVIKHIP